MLASKFLSELSCSLESLSLSGSSTTPETFVIKLSSSMSAALVVLWYHLQKPLIFIDEVHRLAKNQQEVLLPVMENNTILVIGNVDNRRALNT